MKQEVVNLENELTKDRIYITYWYIFILLHFVFENPAGPLAKVKGEKHSVEKPERDCHGNVGSCNKSNYVLDEHTLDNFIGIAMKLQCVCVWLNIYISDCLLIKPFTEITEVNLSAFGYRLFHEDSLQITGPCTKQFCCIDFIGPKPYDFDVCA